jgi:phage/plasmid-associated DNA primase
VVPKSFQNLVDEIADTNDTIKHFYTECITKDDMSAFVPSITLYKSYTSWMSVCKLDRPIAKSEFVKKLIQYLGTPVTVGGNIGWEVSIVNLTPS